MDIKTGYDRSYFYQWDINQTIMLTEDMGVVDKVYFRNPHSNEAYNVDVKADPITGQLYAPVPDELLQEDNDVTVWAFIGPDSTTLLKRTFQVKQRQRPSHYTFTPTEQQTVDEIIKEMNKKVLEAEAFAENAKISAELAQNAQSSAQTSSDDAGRYANDALEAKNIAVSKAEEAGKSATTAHAEAERAKQYADAAGAGVYTAREENELYIHGQGANQSKPVELKVGVEEGKNEASIGYIRTMGLNLLTFDPVYFEGIPDQKTQSARWNYICVEPKKTYTIHFNEPMAIIRVEGRHSDGSRYTIHEANFTDTLTFTDSSRKTVDIYIQSNTFFVPSQIEAQMEFGPRFTEYHEPRGKMYRLNEPTQIKVKKGDYLYKNADGFWYNGTSKLSEADQTVMESIEIPRGPFYLWCESHTHHYMQGLVTLEYTRDIGKALDEKADKTDVYTKVETDEKLARLLMTADTPVFQTDSHGFPIPFQKAHVHVDKGTLKDDVTFTGLPIPDNTLDFEVTPTEMAADGVVLKNIFIQSHADWQTAPSGTNKIFLVPVSITRGHKYYARILYKQIAGISDGSTFYLIPLALTNHKEPINQEAIFSVLGTIDADDSELVLYGGTQKEKIVSYKEEMVIDITDLSARYPQYTDEQLKAILDESLPYISAQQSKTLGGVVTLENRIPTPFTTKGWEARVPSRIPDFAISGSIVTGTSSGPAYNNEGDWIQKETSIRTELGDKLFMRVNATSTKGMSLGSGYQANISREDSNHNQYGIVDGVVNVGKYSLICVGAYENGASKISIDTSKGVCSIEIKSNLLDLWLTLNGIAEDKKADWCNEHIPPFEGTYDLVLGMKNSLTITATCGAHTSSITFKKAISKIDVPSIVESGEGYQRFADGTLKCWGRIETAVESFVNRGSLNQTTLDCNQNFPVPFTKTPYVVMTADNTTDFYGLVVAIASNTTSIRTAVVYDSVSIRTGAIYRANWTAIGRWK